MTQLRSELTIVEERMNSQLLELARSEQHLAQRFITGHECHQKSLEELRKDIFGRLRQHQRQNQQALPADFGEAFQQAFEKACAGGADRIHGVVQRLEEWCTSRRAELDSWCTSQR